MTFVGSAVGSAHFEQVSTKVLQRGGYKGDTRYHFEEVLQGGLQGVWQAFELCQSAG